jgi:hypothetical protein
VVQDTSLLFAAVVEESAQVAHALAALLPVAPAFMYEPAPQTTESDKIKHGPPLPVV